jgi:hypothetical protein
MRGKALGQLSPGQARGEHPLTRNRRAKRSTPHPFGVRAVYGACRRCSRHFHRMEKQEETCDAAKQ